MESVMVSRETIIGEASKEEERVQYDEKDSERLTRAFDAFVAHMTDLASAWGNYVKTLEAPADEDSASNMGLARRELIEKWAIAQCALSKSGWIFRLDGDEAFKRTVDAIKTGKALNMEGL